MIDAVVGKYLKIHVKLKIDIDFALLQGYFLPRICLDEAIIALLGCG